MTQTLKTINLTNIPPITTRNNTPILEGCENEEHELSTEYSLIDTDYYTSEIVETRRYNCNNCTYYEIQEWRADIGEYSYEETLELDYDRH